MLLYVGVSLLKLVHHWLLWDVLLTFNLVAITIFHGHVTNYSTVSGGFIISCWDVFRQFQSYKIAAIWTVWRSNAFLKVFAWVCLDIFRQNSLWRSWAVRTIEMGTTHSIKYQLRFRLRSINSILTFQVSILTFHVFDALNYGINKPKTLYTGICSSTLYESPSFIVVVLMDNSLDTGS